MELTKSLKEILDTHEEVILDTSTQQIKRDCSFFSHIYDINNFFSLDKNYLENKISETNNFLESLDHPSARTIPEITNEILNYAEKLRKKLSYLSTRSRKDCSKNDAENKNEESCKEELFRLLYEKNYNCYCYSREKEIRVNNSKYNSLVEIVISIEKVLHLKRDIGYEKGEVDIDRSHKSDTDEKIVATLLYNSMFSEKSPVLASKDSDFLSLLGAIPKIIGADDFLPYNELFRKQIIKNPFKLYKAKVGYGEKDYSAFFGSIYIDFVPDFITEFKIRKKSLDGLVELREKILNLWKNM